MISIIVFLVLLTLGYFAGQYNEKRHFRAINAREQASIALPVTASKRPIGDIENSRPAELVCGSVVVSIDYFKRIAAVLRQLFGGQVSAYETLLDRGRREAILRLKESCPAAKQVINIRIETSSIYKGQGNQVGSIEVLAYGTAVY